VKYALEQQHLGGVFMWELSQDYDSEGQPLLNAMSTALNEAKKASAAK
jgi:GH18 family chitinase